jgi:hypothetical protein
MNPDTLSTEGLLAKHAAQIDGMLEAFRIQRDINDGLSRRCGAIEVNVAALGASLAGTEHGSTSTRANIVIVVTMSLTILGLIITVVSLIMRTK